MIDNAAPCILRSPEGGSTKLAARPRSPKRRDNSRVVRRMMEEVWAAGDVALLPVLVTSTYVGHLPIGDHYGPDGARIDVESYRRALPDLTVVITDLLAVEDKVVRRFALLGTHEQAFLGNLASGKRVTLTGIAIDRLVDGQIAESWIQIDDSSLRDQP